MANALLDPPFAADPPVKVNIDAKVLGLVIAILAVIWLVFGGLLFGLISVLTFAVFQPIWLLGTLVHLVALVMAAVGGFRMYSMDRSGKQLVIYALALAVVA